MLAGKTLRRGCVLLLVMSVVASAEARLFKGRMQEEIPSPEPIAAAPFGSTVLSATPPVEAESGTVLASGCDCCPKVCLKYRHIGLRRVKSCEPPIETVLSVKNPCTGCPVLVPVCLPGCCTCEPIVTCRPTLLAHGEVTYEWSCGVRVIVRFPKRGDVIVTYHGA